MTISINKVRAFMLAAVIAVSMFAVMASSATLTGATPESKVTICHRNNNVNKPYGPKAIEVAESSVDGQGKGDHYRKHEGPIATSTAVAQSLKDANTKWGDIIPPVEGKHNGLNWTTIGQAIWENDCQFVEFVVAEPVVFVAPTCEVKGTYTIPTTKGVEYYIASDVVAAGTYEVDSDTTITVTAKTIKGYTFSDESDVEWSYEFVTPTDCDEDTPGVVLGDSTITTTPQVKTTPVGSANAGGSGTTALVGLLASTGIFSLSAMIRKFLV